MWVTLTLPDLYSCLTDAERSAVRTASLPAAQTADTVHTAVLHDTCRLARSYIPAPHGPDPSIPDELRSAVLHIARWRLLTRLPVGGTLLTDARRTDHDDALAHIRDARRLSLVPPSTDSTPTPTTPSAGATLIPPPPRL
jgi:hypothetical protein